MCCVLLHVLKSFFSTEWMLKVHYKWFLKEEVYVEQPLGFENFDKPNQVSNAGELEMIMMGELTFFMGLQI